MAQRPATSGSFTSKTAPKGNRRGQKAAKTKLKEAIGLSGWNRLEQYLLNEGADKLCESMLSLKPSQFVIAYQSLAEFVKPKLSRTELSGKDGKDLTITFKEVEDAG